MELESSCCNYNCAVVVSSCDVFSDVWEAFFTLFFRYWPDCPFPIYLISETKKYDDCRVETINLGKEDKWASRIKKALAVINFSEIIYLQEDYLLESKINTERIVHLLNVLRENKAAYLKLCPSPMPSKKFKNYEVIGEIDKKSDYSISLQAAIWNKKILEDFLIKGESGWDTEFNGSLRATVIKEPFLSVYDRALDYFYYTAIKKGVWFYDAVELCKREGIFIDRNYRPVETERQYFKRRLGRLPIIGWVMKFPGRLNNLVKKVR